MRYVYFSKGINREEAEKMMQTYVGMYELFYQLELDYATQTYKGMIDMRRKKEQ